VSLQENIFSQSTEVEEFPIETLVDLLAEPTTDLVPSLAAMRASLFLRSPDVCDPLQIFLQETVSQEIGTLIYGLDFNGAEFTCYVACVLLELPSTAACLSRKPVPPPPPWSRSGNSVFLAHHHGPIKILRGVLTRQGRVSPAGGGEMMETSCSVCKLLLGLSLFLSLVVAFIVF